MVVLKRVNWRRWSGSVALVRVNGGIEKGQWGHWPGPMRVSMGSSQTGAWLWARQGCGCGLS